jgi:hypothetical protein
MTTLHQPLWVFRRKDFYAGILSHYTLAILHCITAIRNNAKLFVDMRSDYHRLYHEDETEVGLTNIWDLYFKQDYDEPLTDYSQMNYKLIDYDWPNQHFFDFSGFENRPDLPLFREAAKKLAVKAEIKNNVDHLAEKFHLRSGAWVGVNYRGGYLAQKASGHFVQPSLDDILKIATNKFRAEAVSGFFVASDDQQVIEQFRLRFGPDRVISLDRPRINSSFPVRSLESKVEKDLGTVFVNQKLNHRIETADFARERNKYKRGLEYIVEMMLLAECKTIIGGRTNGMIFTLLVSDLERQYLLCSNARYS